MRVKNDRENRNFLTRELWIIYLKLQKAIHNNNLIDDIHFENKYKKTLNKLEQIKNNETHHNNQPKHFNG